MMISKEGMRAAITAMETVTPPPGVNRTDWLKEHGPYALLAGAIAAAAPFIHAEALEEAADEFERRAKNVRNNTHIESPSHQSFVEHAENHERNARWLKLRAAALRGDS